MATAVVIQSDDDQYIKYRHGRFEPTQAVAIAKRVLPAAGYYLATMYGVFSEHFTHMGGAYRGLLIATPEVNDDDVARLRGVLFFLKGTYLMIDLVSERAFFDFQTEPHYWKRQESGQLAYDSVRGDQRIQWCIGDEIRNLESKQGNKN